MAAAAFQEVFCVAGFQPAAPISSALSATNRDRQGRGVMYY